MFTTDDGAQISGAANEEIDVAYTDATDSDLEPSAAESFGEMIHPRPSPRPSNAHRGPYVTGTDLGDVQSPTCTE